MPGAFLGSNSVIRKCPGKTRNDCPFAAFVSLSHKVNIAFIANVGRQRVFLAQNLAGFECCFNGSFEKVFGSRVRGIVQHKFLVYRFCCCAV